MVSIDPDIARELIRFGVFAADDELLGKPVPVSSVRTPSGGPQPETGSERTRRTVEAAVMHLIECGLLEIPADIAARLDQPVPLSRGQGPWPG